MLKLKVYIQDQITITSSIYRHQGLFSFDTSCWDTQICDFIINIFVIHTYGRLHCYNRLPMEGTLQKASNLSGMCPGVQK